MCSWRAVLFNMCTMYLKFCCNVLVLSIKLSEISFKGAFLFSFTCILKRSMLQKYNIALAKKTDENQVAIKWDCPFRKDVTSDCTFQYGPVIKLSLHITPSIHAFQVFAIWHWSIRNGCYRLINVTILTQRFHKFFFNFAYKMIILLLDCHIGMLIPILKSLGLQNPKLSTHAVPKSIQNSTFGVVLDYYVQLSCVVSDF